MFSCLDKLWPAAYSPGTVGPAGSDHHKTANEGENEGPSEQPFIRSMALR